MKKIIVLLVLATFFRAYGQENYVIKNLDVNTQYSDFGVSFYGDEVVFASSRPKDNESKRNWTNGQPYLDLYRGGVTPKGDIINPSNFSDIIDTKFHESNTAFTKDGKTVYFSRNNYFRDKLRKDSLGWSNIQLYRADIDEKGKWVNIRPLPFNNDDYSVGLPALSPDEKTLYFASDMPGTMGKTDIFKVSVDGDTYGNPLNLGPQVNTEDREMFPFVADDGLLYFSSDRNGGKGDLDVYVIPTDLDKECLNLGFPINSNSDDFCFVIDDAKKSGFFSSNRNGGKGDDDIYYLEELIAPYSACKQEIAGMVKDVKTGLLLPGTTVVLYKNGEKVESVTVGNDAVYSFKGLECDTKYKITADKDLFEGGSLEITTGGQDGDVKKGDFNLQAEEPQVVIDICQQALNSIENIYFDLDESYIRPDAAQELDKIAGILNQCKEVNVDIRSYTDARASFDYNLTLSQNRATSTLNYLVSKGILKDRLTAKGYGETQLVNRCSDNVPCSESEHQQNRRSEFIIVK